MSCLRSNVSAAKERLAEGLREFKRRHEAGCPGGQLCALMTDSRDKVLRDLFDAALADLGETGTDDLRPAIALIAHGGYGRRDVAPYSDVDLMILHTPASHLQVKPLAERFLRDVFDTGLALGHSVRTPDQASQLASQDPEIATALIESRLLTGSETLFSQFLQAFRRRVRREASRLMGSIVEARGKEQARFGKTVYLLEPNVKRSRGTLRDLQLIRWIGFARYGTVDPDGLKSFDALSVDDVETIGHAREFLLRLRNELHFHAGHAADVLSREEQLRITEKLGYEARSGMLPVELFMRDYFRHTNGVNHVTTQFVATARARNRWTRLVTTVFGHQVDRDLHVGPAGVLATERGLEQVRGNLTAIIKMADLANLYDKPIAPVTWQAVRQNASQLDETPSPEACRHFISLMSHPARLASLLRDLHDTGVLERFIPGMRHARGLLQFNQYHKYTVDAHCLLAVEFATRELFDMGPLGRAYRQIKWKHILHLALLIHDLGKGFKQDHCDVGLRIATETAQRLALPEREAQALRFLVHKHLLMNHLAFRRDTSDEQMVVRFAREVGSPQLLRMLYVLTASDLAAVGPETWDDWKADIVLGLYRHTMYRLAGDSSAAAPIDQLASRRTAVRTLLRRESDREWFLRHIETLPASYANTTEPEQICVDLRMLRDVESGGVKALGRYQKSTQTLQFTVGTFEQATPGVFYKLTGALTSLGLEIRSAQINTLCGGLVLDRFWVRDPDFAEEPPPQRLEQVIAALVGSLEASCDEAPSFRKTWKGDGNRNATAHGNQARVNADNTTSDDYTILDVFTVDRTGLLYSITRTLFEAGLSVWRAKIGTYLDQVVDVFYVTQQDGRKIEDESRLREIRRRLLEVIGQHP